MTIENETKRGTSANRRRNLKIRAYELVWHPQVRRWTCECSFSLRTAKQFSDEWLGVKVEARWMLVALFSAYRMARLYEKDLGAKPGERQAKGWV